ncbi:hypothetical protein ACIBBB_32330 [Streptomyces sp. NPDC051217]|uniref:hypothetical protein n=1 Tax=Streptomyces sp. NPDC051217 TaxID=3365644 RepID=UPI00379D6424
MPKAKSGPEPSLHVSIAAMRPSKPVSTPSTLLVSPINAIMPGCLSSSSVAGVSWSSFTGTTHTGSLVPVVRATSLNAASTIAARSSPYDSSMDQSYATPTTYSSAIAALGPPTGSAPDEEDDEEDEEESTTPVGTPSTTSATAAPTRALRRRRRGGGGGGSGEETLATE